MEENIEILEMSITSDYIPHWSVAAALREFLQNALDADTQGLTMEISEDPERENWIQLINWGASLPIRTLLLGVSTKADKEEEIGQFGEGYKLACLVLTREDIPVEISSPEGTIIPFIGFSNQFQTDLLMFKWDKGTTFPAGIKISFPKRKVSESWLKSLILLDRPHDPRLLRNKPGRVYSGGLYLSLDLGQEKLEDCYHWGYNIFPADLKLDRDRGMVDPRSLRDATVKILEQDATSEEIYDAIMTPYPEFSQIPSYFFSGQTLTAVRNEFKKKYGEFAHAVEFSVSEEMLGLVENAGFIPIRMKTKTGYAILNGGQKDKDELRQVVANRGIHRKEYKPTEEEAKRIDRVIKILADCTDARYIYLISRIKDMKISTVLFTDPNILGSYSPDMNEIALSAKVLESVGKLMLVLIHEMCHAEYPGHGLDFHQGNDNAIIGLFNYLIEKE
ncbi:hypothetical protein LCGC14_0729610 [marine sediment metagenome]|uniref:Uncharacterized protein n=1 Tax=marine sediment metagenome TaxID=412755 RepID=A0A0F9QE84_9ZZZZ